MTYIHEYNCGYSCKIPERVAERVRLIHGNEVGEVDNDFMFWGET